MELFKLYRTFFTNWTWYFNCIFKNKVIKYTMASTRNKNTVGNYCDQQRQLQKQEDWFMRNYKFENPRPAYPCAGINVQHVPWNELAGNPVDIETYLYGISANNFVNPLPPLVPELKTFNNISFFETPKLFIPVLPPYLHGQRPF
jgi:hypothetical protein